MGKIHILHVDDDPQFRQLVKSLLETKHDELEVTTAPDAASGIKKAHSSNFDCIVSDYEMPGKNGIEFLNDFRRIDSRTPFILFTAVSGNEVKNKALSQGADKFVHKSSGGHNVLVQVILNYV